MSGLKFDANKPASYLLAHDVVAIEDEDYITYDMPETARWLRSWWNKAGPLPGLSLSRSDYFGIVKVLEFGAQKYTPRNWEGGIAYSRVFRAAMDHYARMPDKDEETGLPHRHHFLCCYMFLAAYTTRGLHQFDDRPGVGPFILLEKETSNG